MYLTDLHNHTIYSYDGEHSPEEIIENALENDLAVVGITDHQFSINERLAEYHCHLNRLKKQYEGRIRVLAGLEIGTRPHPRNLLASALEDFDYVLFESLDHKNGMDLYEFLEWRRLFECKVGLAHTDIFGLGERYGLDMIKIMKAENIFWEWNLSGHYPYYERFLDSPEQLEIVSKSGIEISIGSDVHQLTNFNKQKLIEAHTLHERLGNPFP